MGQMQATVSISFDTMNKTLVSIQQELAEQRLSCVQEKYCLREMAIMEKRVDTIGSKLDLLKR